MGEKRRAKIPKKVAVSNTRKLIIGETDKQKLDNLYFTANRLMKDIALVVEKRKYPNKMVVQKYYYYLWKQKYDLPSQIIINCIDKVIEAFRASWEKSSPLPRFTELPIRLARNRSYYLDEDGSVRITVGSGKNNSVCGEVRNLTYPVELARGAELLRRGNEYYLTITFVRDFEKYKPEYSIGIDYNTDAYCVAVVDRRGALIDYRFFPHNFLNIVEYWSNKSRKRAKAKLKDVLENRYKKVMNDIYNYISGYQTFVFVEELDAINQKTAMLFRGMSRNKHHSLPFRRAYEYLRVKLLWNNIFVDEVYPYGTSTTCSDCGKKGKREGKVFYCGECGEKHADLNAGINMAKRGMKKWGKMFANSSPR